MRKQRQRWMRTYNKMKNSSQKISENGLKQKRQKSEKSNGREIEHEYDGNTRSMMRREQMVISRLRTGYTRATHVPRMNGVTGLQCPFCDIGLPVDHVLWDCTETEQTKREMMLTPEIWIRGAEGMKKIIEYTRIIGFYDGI
jgi:hypothetical protein